MVAAWNFLKSKTIIVHLFVKHLLLSGSNAIRLNFRFRFVLGRTGEKFSFTESVSFVAPNLLLAPWSISAVWSALTTGPGLLFWFWFLFDLRVECVCTKLGLGNFSSSESDNWRLDVPLSLVKITARVSSSVELEESSLFWDWFFFWSVWLDELALRQARLL